MLDLLDKLPNVGQELLWIDIVEEIDVDLVLPKQTEGLAVFSRFDVFNHLCEQHDARRDAFQVPARHLQHSARPVDCHDASTSLDGSHVEVTFLGETGELWGLRCVR